MFVGAPSRQPSWTDDHEEARMATVEAWVDVEAPVSTAYDQWTQFEQFPQFMEGIVEVRQVDDTHLHWIAEVSGRRQEWDAEIVEQVPDEVIAWRSTGGDDNSGRVTFQPTEDGTRVSVQIDWDPSGMTEKVGAALGRDEHQVEKDLDRFKELVERRGTPTGAWRGTIDPDRGDDVRTL
jgi:uncharacterized membrane protein